MTSFEKAKARYNAKVEAIAEGLIMKKGIPPGEALHMAKESLRGKPLFLNPDKP